MQIYYIFLPKDNLIEIIIDSTYNNINKQYYFKLLKDIFRSTTGVNLVAAIPSQFKILIKSNYLYFHKKLTPILETYGFIVIPDTCNKITVYYKQLNNNTLELCIAHSEKQLSEFLILSKLLLRTIETIKHNNPEPDNKPFKIIKHVPFEFKIIIYSEYLFKTMPLKSMDYFYNTHNPYSVMSFLRANGFNTIQHQTTNYNTENYIYLQTHSNKLRA